MGEKELVLPPGLEFEPTDEELILYFLCRRAATIPCNPNIIPDLDFYASDPWDLNDKAFGSKRGWYFFSRWKESNNPRSTRKGFWKELGLNEPIFTSDSNEIIGIKKYLVYYYGGGDWVGSCTNWIMSEYHLLKNGCPIHQENARIQDVNEWVLCRVCEEENTVNHFEGQDCHPKSNTNDGVELSYLDEVFLSMEDDDPDEVTSFNQSN